MASHSDLPPSTPSQSGVRDCPACTQILQLVFDPIPKDTPYVSAYIKPDTSCWGTCSQILCSKVDGRWISKSTHSSFLEIYPHYYGITIDYKDTHTPELPLIRILRLDTDWINIPDLRERPIRCLEAHGSACAPGLNNPAFSGKPSWLIDVKRMCITPWDVNMQYLALSYVWGRVPGTKLLKSNLDRLKQDNALSLSCRTFNLPKTVDDAIQLTSLLQQRYLWVDSLCLVQDDADALAEQINSMASIYANAYVTIIAAEGEDANYGLHGIRELASPEKRVVYQRIYRMDGEYYLSRLRESSRYTVQNTPWSKRAWTFQERFCSSRRIVFSRNTVSWECSVTLPEEIKDLSLRARDGPCAVRDYALRGFQHISWPNLHGYLDIVMQFNQKELTYPEDVFRAFAGVTTVLGYSFEGGFVCGLPELFFDVALLWYPGFGNLRYASDPALQYRIPSWTWACFKGRLRPTCWPTDHVRCLGYSNNDIMFYTSCRVVPSVQWYCGETLSGPRRALQGYSTLRKYMLKFRDPQKPLPSGWSRHFIRDPILPQSYGRLHTYDKEEDICYTHASDPKTLFWYPVPICDPEKPQPPRPLEPYLFCRTQRAFLAYGLSYDDNDLTLLFTETSEWGGILNVSKQDHIKFAYHCATQLSDPLCEIIIISEGHALYSYYNWDGSYLPEATVQYLERPSNGEMYEYVNVLWIVWNSGIAYRRGVGRVFKSIWEKLDLEWIDVVLN